METLSQNSHKILDAHHPKQWNFRKETSPSPTCLKHLLTLNSNTCSTYCRTNTNKQSTVKTGTKEPRPSGIPSFFSFYNLEKCDKWIHSLQVCLQLCDNSISLHYHLIVMLDWPWKPWSSKNLENASSDLGLCFRVPVAHKQNAEKGMQTPIWNNIREDSSNNRWPQPHLMIVNIYCHTWKRDYWSQ